MNRQAQNAIFESHVNEYPMRVCRRVHSWEELKPSCCCHQVDIWVHVQSQYSPYLWLQQQRRLFQNYQTFGILRCCATPSPSSRARPGFFYQTQRHHGPKHWPFPTTMLALVSIVRFLFVDRQSQSMQSEVYKYQRHTRWCSRNRGSHGTFGQLHTRTDTLFLRIDHNQRPLPCHAATTSGLKDYGMAKNATGTGTLYFDVCGGADNWDKLSSNLLVVRRTTTLPPSRAKRPQKLGRQDAKWGWSNPLYAELAGVCMECPIEILSRCPYAY